MAVEAVAVADCCGREQEALYYYSEIHVVYIVIIWCAQTMFALVWSQVQHGNGLINHVMIAYPKYRFGTYQHITG